MTLLLSVGLALLPAQALATGRVATRVSVAATPTTAHIHSVVVVSGTVSPHAAGTVAVQRLVGRSWRTVAHGKVAGRGHYAVSLRAPGTALTWQLRVVGAKATSATVRVHVVKAIYAVRAVSPQSVASGTRITVTGSVSPKATGTVALQGFQHNVWTTIGTGRLTKASTFSLSTTKPTGSYKLRVVRGFTAKVAAGSSKALTVVVAAPIAPTAPPAITTTSVPGATVGFHYATALQAAGGLAPYTWSSSGGAPGLLLSAQGELTGTPTTAASSALTATVTDALGHTASTTLTVSVAHGVAHGWGDNMDDKIGDGTSLNRATPVPVKTITDVIGVSGATDAGYALTADGTVWAWGFNASGQLGDGTTTSHSTPAPVYGLTGVSAITGGNTAGYALKSNGTVWAWGYGGQGQLGNGGSISSPLPVPVSNLVGVKAVAAGEGTAYALLANGTVWAWGSNDDGALGDGGAEGTSALPVQVAGLTGVIGLAAGGNHAYALLSDGTVRSWGYNGSGELGDGTTTSRDTPVPVSGLSGVTSIASGSETAYVIKSDGSVWAWGYGAAGQLGNGGTSDSHQPVQVPGLSHAVSVAGTGLDGFAVLADGTAYGWGFNVDGETGNGTTTPSPGPSLISGLSHVLVIGSGPESDCAYAITSG